MKKRALSLTLALCMMCSLLSTGALGAGETATPSPTKFLVNGKSVTVDAYAINGNNYIKIRDMAYIINGTAKSFEVTWDGAKNAINLKSKTPYTPTSADMAKGDGQNRTATLATSKIYVDGASIPMTAYLIGQSNYFKLRDVMQIFDVYVGYADGTATLDTSKGYEKPAGTAAVAPTVVQVADPFKVDNEFYHEYTRQLSNNRYILTRHYSNPITSHLLPQADDTLLRVQYNPNGNMIVAQTYDKSLKLLSTKELPQELPLYGGFYAGKDFFFLVTGQKNDAEDDTAEVIRVAKYDKNWNLLGQTALKGIFATIPFDSGSLNMLEKDGKLLVHTCQVNYTHPDGERHQTNLIFSLDIAAMRLEQVSNFATVKNSVKAPYCSHSFNQYIAMGADGTVVVTAHGDGAPRAMMLAPLNLADITTNTPRAEFLPLSGERGNNLTAAMLGGLEISSSNILSVGTTADQNFANFNARDGGLQNIFVAVTDKNDMSKTQITTFTDYKTGISSASNPFLVKVGTDRYMMLWNEQTKAEDDRRGYRFEPNPFVSTPVLCYTYLDGQGRQLGAIQKTRGYLSDCRPIVVDGKVMWYVTKGGNLNFYSLPVGNLSALTPVTPGTGSDTAVPTKLENGWNLIGCQGGYVTVNEAGKLVLTKTGTPFLVTKTGGTSVTIQDPQMRYVAPSDDFAPKSGMEVKLSTSVSKWYAREYLGMEIDGLRFGAYNNPDCYLSFADGAEGTPALLLRGDPAPFTRITLSFTPTTAPAPVELPPEPPKTLQGHPYDALMTVDGVFKTSNYYSVDKVMFFSLRNMAVLVNGTGKNFNITVSGSDVAVTSQTTYTPTGDETVREGNKRLNFTDEPSLPVNPVSGRFTLDGVDVTIPAYEIGGEVYCTMPEFFGLLGITVDKDPEYRTLIVKTK